jgi:hypothetical protein
VSDDKWMYVRGDMVVLGISGLKEAGAEEVKEVGRYFLMYEIQQVGMIPIDSTQTTQLVIPLNSHPSIFLFILTIICMAILPCFF